MAKILLTGAFGNVGSSTLNELVKHDHHIRCFDIPTKKNKKKAKQYKDFQDKIEIFWGDLRNSSDVDKAVEDREVIIHLGAIIPPLANQKPEIAEPVNIGGTKNILNAMKKQKNPPRLLFSSSVATYGDVRHKGLDYIIKIDDEFNPSPHDHYARHKVKCEELIRKSGLDWVIFRFSAIGPIDQGIDPLMFEVPLDTPIEHTDTGDTGRALARAAVSDEVIGKTLHIAGGPINRMPYEQFVGGILEAMGIGRLPKEAFGKKPFHCGYMDTTESQRILQYQEHTFEDYIAKIRKRLAFARILAIIFKPIVRYWLLNKSPYYKAHIASMKQYLKPKRKPRKTKRTKSKGIQTKDITKKILDKKPSKTGK
jgi:nucleoside-diphosphate-sugar epimerase